MSRSTEARAGGEEGREMIKDPDKMVKDFNTGEVVPRHSVKVLEGKCAGCGAFTNHYDHRFGWHVCIVCDSDEIAADISDHVMNPNRGMF